MATALSLSLIVTKNALNVTVNGLNVIVNALDVTVNGLNVTNNALDVIANGLNKPVNSNMSNKDNVDRYVLSSYSTILTVCLLSLLSKLVSNPSSCGYATSSLEQSPSVSFG